MRPPAPQVCTLALPLLLAAGCAHHVAPAGPDDPLSSPRTEWFREARFGMFIHWGVYAVPAGVWKGKDVPGVGEWIMDRGKIPIPEYETFAAGFNPTKFDAEAWTKLASDAGMRYLVITSKHHDGFSMFDSGLTSYDIVDATPYRKDVMEALAKACAKHGIRFCFYHSIMDWHHPDQRDDFPAYVTFLKGQVRELLTKYGPIGIMWFDGEWIKQWTPEHGNDLEAYVRSLQPDVVINNRVGKRQRDDGDYETPEQHIPAGAIKGRLWETCMTMNGTWGYKQKDHNWKSTEDLVRKLVDISSKGGNFLLNVGPTAEGLIPDPSAQRLREMGAWLRTNGEAIYGTEASPYTRHPFNGRCTTKGNTLYVHVFEWPEDRTIELTGLRTPVRKTRLLSSGTPSPPSVTAANASDAVRIVLTGAPPTSPATVVALELAEPPEVDNRIRQGKDGTVRLPAMLARIDGKTARYESGGGKDNIGFWTNSKDRIAWAFVLLRPGTYGVEITYACAKGSGGSRYRVAIGDQVVSDTVVETGAWTTFVAKSLGTLSLAAPGTATLSVIPESKPGLAVMNLKSIVLRPTATEQAP